MSHTNFLGIPVEGDIYKGDKRKAQRPIEEFRPLLEAVLNDDLFAEMGWDQYTPYFNDGDPCTFSVNAPWFLTTLDPKRPDEDADDDEGDDEEFDTYTYQVDFSTHPTLGGMEGYPDRQYVGEREEKWRVYAALSDAIEGGEFLDVLLEAFGDHARIVVRRDGITVETYEHD